VFNKKIDFSKSFLEYIGDVTDVDITFLFYVHYNFIDQPYRKNRSPLRVKSYSIDNRNNIPNYFPFRFDKIFQRHFFDNNTIKGMYISRVRKIASYSEPNTYEQFNGYVNIAFVERNNLLKDVPISMFMNYEKFSNNPNVVEFNNLKIDFDNSYFLLLATPDTGNKIFDINFFY
jgi:hypothetical protein